MKPKRAILCLGSNTGNGVGNINSSVELLEKAALKVVGASDVYPSASGYTNKVIVCDTSLAYNQLLLETKEIEKNLGRTPDMKEQNIVPIDIDIVLYDSVVKRPADFRCAYFKEGFNQAQYRMLYPENKVD